MPPLRLPLTMSDRSTTHSKGGGTRDVMTDCCVSFHVINLLAYYVHTLRLALTLDQRAFERLVHRSTVSFDLMVVHRISLSTLSQPHSLIAHLHTFSIYTPSTHIHNVRNPPSNHPPPPTHPPPATIPPQLTPHNPPHPTFHLPHREPIHHPHRSSYGG